MFTVLSAVMFASLLVQADEQAWNWERLELAPGLELDLAVQLPATGLGDTPVPVLLALPPGDQDVAMVERGLQLYWSSAALARGWVLVSPAAPGGRSFHGDDVQILEALLDALDARFDIAGGKPHLAGVSNGGLSALELALRDPGRVGSLTGAPGMPPADADPAQLARLAELPVALFVGGADSAWLNPMRRLRDTLSSAGALRLSLVEFAGEGHVPESLTPERLFQQLDAFHAHRLRRHDEESAARRLLDDFHRAAAESDEDRYFACFAPEGVFVGTDASERWNVSEFRTVAHPYFERGEGWTYIPIERHLRLSPRGEIAWFDERLDSPKYGEMRGTGVLRRVGDSWRVSQYVLSFPVPNEHADELVERIAGGAR
ncbi:MAG: hypothetical protein DHS20C15_15690 [Planctomycetota bacterium]|nr:MAG: hypothetical protein DHS20C15_15690 [Planctomycetota bacterium]